ncbi:MAG: helix-turn-helix domain-containing protein [Candidatus Cloacimonetes bacterium]|jgi:DNA-binding Xre family transcriptional regulator|nr:helix-turn-helix domain-containing protein [Candidatus Cloacimonadota bacterium]
MSFARKFNLLMKKKKIANTDLVTKFLTTCATDSRWRNGLSNFPLEILPKPCVFLGCTLDDLLKTSNPTQPPAGLGALQGEMKTD